MDAEDSLDTGLQINAAEAPSVAVVKQHTSRRSWLVALTGSLFLLAIWGNFFSYGVILVPLLCQFQSGRAVTSLVGSVGYGFSVSGGPIAMRLTDKFGAPRLLVGCLLLTTVGVFLSSLPNSIYPLFFTYTLLVGVGGFAYVSVVAETPSYFSPKQQALAIAFVESGSVAGMLVLAPVLSVLVNLLGWRRALWAHSAVLFVLMLPAPFFYRNRNNKEWIQQRNSFLSITGAESDEMQLIADSETSHEDSTGEGNCVGGGDAESRDSSTRIDEESSVIPSSSGIRKSRLPESIRPYKEILLNRQYVLLVVVAALYYYSFTTPALFVVDESTKIKGNDSDNDDFPTDLSSPRCQPKITDALLYTYMSLVQLVLFLLVGWLFDHIPSLRQRVLIMQTLYLFGIAAVLFAAKFHTENWHFVVFAVIFGVARTPDCLHQALVLQIVGESLYPYGWALVCLISGVADGISPSIAGWMADKTGSFTLPFVLIAVVLVISIILITFLPNVGSKGTQCWPNLQRLRKKYRMLEELTSDRSQNGILVSAQAASS